MSESKTGRSWVIVGLLCSLMLAVDGGCGSKTQQPLAGSAVDDHVQALTTLYIRFLGQNRGHMPKDEAEFKQFMRSQSPQSLAGLGVTEVDAIFRSSRNQEPMHVAYGGGKVVEFPSHRMISYEQASHNGKRLVAMSTGYVVEVDESVFEKMKEVEEKGP